MTPLRAIIYRYLTDADFFNINKPTGTEAGGGGQSYIDFSTVDVELDSWREFLADLPGLTEEAAAKGPRWELPIASIGLPGTQTAEIYQRRAASVIIARQKLGTRRSNRLRSWSPTNGFPRPMDPEDRQQCPPGLAVYLVRTQDQVLAGWFLNDGRSPLPVDRSDVRRSLQPLFDVPDVGDPRAGIVWCQDVWLEVGAAGVLFRGPGGASAASTSEDDLTGGETSEEEIDDLFDRDVAPGGASPQYNVARVRKRNTKAVAALKALYDDSCQVTGQEFLFRRRDGRFYTEVHHLIPLGQGGADDPRNMIVVNPQLHRMLHYALVEPINLGGMRESRDGSGLLDITINGVVYTIRWRPEHARVIRRYESAG